MSAPPFLRVVGLAKRYPGVVALDDAHLTIEAGRVLGLVGKNGAGKSTLIKILAGAVAPDAGSILLDGAPCEISDPHHATAMGLSFVHQELADIPNLSVAENIEIGLGYPRRLGLFVDRRALRARAREVLERLGAEIDPRAELGSLTIAQRRLVMIARALAAEARLVVLDEPTASLTEEEINHLHATLRGIAAEGVAVVYVSHRLEEITSVTDTVSVMRDGRVVAEAETGDLDRARLIDLITGSAIGHGEHAARQGAELGEELLRVEGLSRPGHVEGVSFSLRRGEILGIAGLVGAGRSELVRLVFGADHASAGRVVVAGEERRIRSPRDAIRAGVVLLPEDRRHQGSVQDFSVRANITLSQLRRFRWSQALPVPRLSSERRAAKDVIERLRIKVADQEEPVRHLSGGNQQKVMLAKWLDSGADVFIFDEPTHGIDVEGKDEVYRTMDRLSAAGKGVIFISSDFDELVGSCDRVLVMREGRLVAELAGSQVTEATLVERSYTA